MKKYFYTNGTNNYGPFSLNELKTKNITRETKVWFQELGEWKPAGLVPELEELFNFAPPPPSQATPINPNMNNNQTPPKTWLVESILVTLFCCLPFGIAGIVNASKVESRFRGGDIHGAIKASADARKWTMTSFWIGIIVGVIYFVFGIILGLADEIY